MECKIYLSKIDISYLFLTVSIVRFAAYRHCTIDVVNKVRYTERSVNFTAPNATPNLITVEANIEENFSSLILLYFSHET